MNRKILHFFGVVLLCAFAGCYYTLPFELKDYYYSFDQKVYIGETNNFIVEYDGSVNAVSERLAVTGLKKQGFTGSKILGDHVIKITSDNAEAKADLLNTIRQRGRIKYIHRVFKDAENNEFGVRPELMLQLKDSSAYTIKDVIKIFGGELTKESSSFYLLSFPADSDVLAIGNRIQESGMTLFCSPNFIRDYQQHQVIPNDTYFGNQWNLKNTGTNFNDGHTGTANADINVTNAWTLTKGNPNIIVAVIDDGVTSNHIDLPNTRQVRLPGSNFVNDSDPNDPSPLSIQNHGNACAGIIAATLGNNLGVAGIAPNVKIMPIRVMNIFGQVPNDAILASAIDFAVNNYASIISLSLGAASTNPNLTPAVVTALNRAVTIGRGGKGTIITVSAGNTADQIHGSAGIVGFPANAAIPNMIAVGASDRYDHQANYSPTGTTVAGQRVHIVAPSHRAYPSQITGESFEIWTIDRPEYDGYNPWNETGYTLPAYGALLPSSGPSYLHFTGRMGGTSTSSPETAAAAALALSVDTNRTAAQMFTIMTSSADKVGGYTYNASGYSNEMGYGRLNACSAVKQAFVTASIKGATEFCTSAALQCGNVDVPITWTASPAGAVTITGSGNAVTVTKNFDATVTFSATITACGTSTVASKVIKAGFPSLTGSISGNSAVSPGGIYTYSFTMGTGVLPYTISWQLPSGWILNYGLNTNVIQVTASSTPGNVTALITKCGVVRPMNKYVTIGGGGGPGARSAGMIEDSTQFERVKESNTVPFNYSNDDDVTVANWSAYPNPASNYINIDIPKVENHGKQNSGFGPLVTLYDANGVLVKTQPLPPNTGKTIMYLPQLKPGVYLVVIIIDNKRYTKKIIKL